MTRSLTADDIVQLPRLSANEAAVLSTELLNEAASHKTKKHGLPAAIEPSRKRLENAKSGLDAALAPVEPTGLDPKLQVLADRTIDNAWSATFDWLRGWTKLPAAKHGAEAKALFTVLFPGESLSFTQRPYKVEWQESQTRLAAIESNAHDKTFKNLGGEAFLHHIKEAQKNYGAALGITVRKAAPAEPPSVRPALDAVLSALRVYVNKATAYSDPEIDGSAELASALLAPLANWQSRVTNSGVGPTPTEPTIPPTPTPTAPAAT